MEQITSSPDAVPNTTIKVNNEEVVVNKHILALFSPYFDRYFFDDRYPKAENIELPESTTVKDFKRLIAALPPKKRKLKDECIEAVLILADRFAMDKLLELCRDFLIRKSKKPILFKFRMAHKYGWNEMKEQILRAIHLEELGMNFVENATEFGLLDDDAKAAITARHAQLVSSTVLMNAAECVLS